MPDHPKMSSSKSSGFIQNMMEATSSKTAPDRNEIKANIRQRCAAGVKGGASNASAAANFALAPPVNNSARMVNRKPVNIVAFSFRSICSDPQGSLRGCIAKFFRSAQAYKCPTIILPKIHQGRAGNSPTAIAANCSAAYGDATTFAAKCRDRHFPGRKQKNDLRPIDASRFISKIVGLTGIEPALPKELDPKSSASASSATAPVRTSPQSLVYTPWRTIWQHSLSMNFPQSADCLRKLGYTRRKIEHDMPN